MNTDQDINELSVAQLFRDGQYVIPIYQRNYAWGEPEVEQLLQDVMDMALRDESNGAYYLGSLVAYRRPDGHFETIDGQQRHTTLSIVLAVLKNEFGQALEGVERINLSFDSRPKSQTTLRRLFAGSSQHDGQPLESGICGAYDIAKRYFTRDKANLDRFVEYLLHQVTILRVVVPDDTDLNHYFEVMNNRGEQLEKHEVLKASLMSQLGDDLERSSFARVWDACSDMNRYVQMGIDSDVRAGIFGADWNTCPTDFTELCQQQKEGSASDTRTLADIIENPKFAAVNPDSTSDNDGAFGAVINFSNFLLHVLRVTSKEDLPLDDKRLLDTFAEHHPDPRQFIMDLLKCRMLFDKYIIKRENEEDWSLKGLRLYDRKNQANSMGYVNSFESPEQNLRLIMLLSMFHVSFPTLVYKHWLNAALHFLYKNTHHDLTIDGSSYLIFLESLSDKFFYGRFGKGEPLDYFHLTYSEPNLPREFDRSYLDQGTGVQNFIFNRLDYRLWLQLRDGTSFPGVDMSYVRGRHQTFRFSFRTSVEHYYPQNPLGGSVLKASETLPNGVDSFGNLCLISHSNNSKLSNYLPTAKKEHYDKATAVESLKQVFMMSYKHWGPEQPEVIAAHERMMIEVLR
ncbi:DUF262 domain-containing protein [Microbulbifer sp. YPW1]|uniref:DUF262 domain-containing protein n=1 Tax=Microbulbifer sp. YPW1 TaxID=2745199 RepID=UPI0015990BB2|nr:DUF262 domain-containing protein [Microbulbifer sp. YPW1]QKX17316.1 DUF262 domain-containing protein [Microbulbifer sp. YPW1]